MKNSIGSLAALAAFAAPALVQAGPYSSDVREASFSNVSISLSNVTPIDFDIDGDGTADFSVYGNSGFAIRIDPYDPAALSSAGPVTFGSTFEIADATQSSNSIINQNTLSYYGFSFTTGSEVHAAWVQFDTNTLNPVVVGGGWQASPGLDITVGVIPEPSTAGAFAGAAALLGALAVRRRRTTL
jgi:hypothetical protein